MTEGTILRAARGSAKGVVSFAIAILALCAIIYAFSWKYMFNWVSGPVPFTAALSANPGVREFVTVEGPFVSTGLTEQSEVKLKRVKVGEFTSADYKMVNVEGRMLIVKLPTDFSGNVVAGRLEPMPGEMADVLKPDKFHPWVVVEQNYRIDANLFVLIAFVLTPLAVLLLLYGLRRVARPENAAAIRGLKRFGQVDQVLAGIESQIATVGAPSEKDSITITPEWVVVWKPLLDIFSRNEVAGVGVVQTTKTSGSQTTVKKRITFWVKDRYGNTEVEADEATLPQIMQRIREQFAGRFIEDTAAFGKSWPKRMNEEVELTPDITETSPLKGLSSEVIAELEALGAKRNDDFLSASLGVIKSGAKELIPGWAREFCSSDVCCISLDADGKTLFFFGPDEDRNYVAVFTRAELAEQCVEKFAGFQAFKTVVSINGLSLLEIAKKAQRGIWINPLNDACSAKLSPNMIGTIIEIAREVGLAAKTPGA